MNDLTNKLLRCFGFATAVAVLAAGAGVAETMAPLVASIHGSLVGQVRDHGGTLELPLPGAQIEARDEAGKVVGKTITDANGRFATPSLPAGSYTICGLAGGFKETCEDNAIAIAKDDVALNRVLSLPADGSALHGRVTLKDGAPALRLALASGQTAAAAEISLVDAAGKVVAGPVRPNQQGDYVIAPVTLRDGEKLVAKYEGASVTLPLTAIQADLDGGIPLNVTFPTSSPTITGVSMTVDGQPALSAPIGAKVTLSLQVDNPDKHALHYHWSAGASEGLNAVDAPTITWALPAGAQANEAFVEVTDGQGGVARRTVVVPMVLPTTTGGERHTIQGKIDNRGIVNGRLPICVIDPLVCQLPPPPPPPAHAGLFIDPTTLMNGVCTDEASCEKEAINYYKTIGALDANGKPTVYGTFKGFKKIFGFGASPLQPTSGEIVSTYYNNGDLQFGRDMHCRNDTPADINIITVVCYVSNYGAGGATFGASPQPAIANAAANTGRIATVAMQYVYIPGLPTLPSNKYPVNFYVFGGSLNGDFDDGGLLTSAKLDGDTGAKAVPGLCLSCHGGSYDATPGAHNALSSNFLPFDSPTFFYSTSNTSLEEAAQREPVRQLNSLVADLTQQRATITQLITGWYSYCGGVGKANCYIDDANHPFFPNESCVTGADNTKSCGWPATLGGINAQSFYQSVPRLRCRTCHVALSNFFNPDFSQIGRNRRA